MAEYVTIQMPDLELFKQQRRGLLAQEGDEAQGLTNFLDHIADEIEKQTGHTEHLLTEAEDDELE